MVKRVPALNLSFWIQGLCDLSLAESHLSDVAISLSRRLELSMNCYLLGLSKLKNVTNPSRALTFQAEFSRQRIEFLSSCLQLIQACRILQLIPLPLPAQIVAVPTRDELMRFARITVQLKKLVVQLRQAGDAMSKLRQSAFDADQESLVNLQVQQQMALILAQTVESTCLSASQQDDVSVEDSFLMISKIAQATEHVAVRNMASRCAESVDLVRRFWNVNTDLKEINLLVRMPYLPLRSVTVFKSKLIFVNFLECWMYHGLLETANRNTSLFSAIPIPDTADHFY
jgi:integrator complex subunit 7